MSVRNDCRIERVLKPVAFSASGREMALGDPILPGTIVKEVPAGVTLDLCFAVGDAVVPRPWLEVGEQFNVLGEWYTVPSRPLLFLGLDGLIDDRLQRHVAKVGIDDPPIPFYDPEDGLVYLPLTAIDQVFRADGPRRSRWVIGEVTSTNMLSHSSRV